MVQVDWFESAGPLNLDINRRWIHQGVNLSAAEQIRAVQFSIRAWTNQVPDPGSTTPNFSTVVVGVTIGDDIGTIPPDNPAVTPSSRDWLIIAPIRWNILRRTVSSTADVSSYELTTYGLQREICPRDPVPAGRSIWMITSEMPTTGDALEWNGLAELRYYSQRP